MIAIEAILKVSDLFILLFQFIHNNKPLPVQHLYLRQGFGIHHIFFANDFIQIKQVHHMN